MSEHQPKRRRKEKSPTPAEIRAARMQELRTQLASLEKVASHVHSNTIDLKHDEVEHAVLAAEKELRELESAGRDAAALEVSDLRNAELKEISDSRKAEIRKELAELNKAMTHAHSNTIDFKHDEIEQRVLALEAELREMESGTSGIEVGDGDVEEVVMETPPEDVVIPAPEPTGIKKDTSNDVTQKLRILSVEGLTQPERDDLGATLEEVEGKLEVATVPPPPRADKETLEALRATLVSNGSIPDTEEYISSTAEPKIAESPLTPSAQKLLEDTDLGVPPYMSEKLIRVAAENGIVATRDMRPGPVVDQLREKSERVPVGEGTPAEIRKELHDLVLRINRLAETDETLRPGEADPDSFREHLSQRAGALGKALKKYRLAAVAVAALFAGVPGHLSKEDGGRALEWLPSAMGHTSGTGHPHGAQGGRFSRAEAAPEARQSVVAESVARTPEVPKTSPVRHRQHEPQAGGVPPAEAPHVDTAQGASDTLDSTDGNLAKDSPSSTVGTTTPGQVINDLLTQARTPEAPSVANDVIRNPHGFKMSTKKFHIYSDAKEKGERVFVYGGDNNPHTDEKWAAIKEYLMEYNPGGSVYELGKMNTGGTAYVQLEYRLDVKGKVENVATRPVSLWDRAFSSSGEGFTNPLQFKKFIQ